jgi:kynurenine formamidase
MEMHGGVEVDPSVQTYTGFTRLGVETIAPIVTRGVLLDAARHAGVERLPEGDSVEDLGAVAEAQGVEVRPGDVVLVRTGNGAVFGDRPAYERGAGIGAGASRWLAERRPLAVGADNLAWDTPGKDDPELGSVPGHVVLIVRAGIYILESVYLEELARDGHHEFAFVCLPLKMRGGTGSPVRPIALV